MQHKGVVNAWIMASVLLVLAACTSVPLPPLPQSSPSSSPSMPSVHPPMAAQTPGLTVDTALPAEATVDEKYRLTGEAARELERGQASWYGPRFHGRRTASGERYSRYALTAAHRTLPFGTLVRVSSLLAPGREVEVRINDRGPFAAGRVIDLSEAAAEALGLLALGVTQVSLRVPESTALQMEPLEPVRQVRRAKRSSPPAKRL